MPKSLLLNLLLYSLLCMSDNFSVVIRLSRPSIVPEKFFRVYGIRNVKALHKELAETLNLDNQENRKIMPSYLDTYNLCNYCGIKIKKEEFQSLSGELIQEWWDRHEDYEYQEYIVKK
jgi:hypothetical protein